MTYCESCGHYKVCKDKAEYWSNCPNYIEPVRHGKWIEHKYAEEHGGKIISNFECSECHMWLKSERGYCGECGAKMVSDYELSK